MITRIEGGRVIDPGHIEQVKDVIFEDGTIIGVTGYLHEKSRGPYEE